MSRFTRALAGTASAALLMGLAVPTASYADDAAESPTHHAGACEGDTGVTMVVDYQDLGGGAEVRCFLGDPADGVEALRGAGFTMESPKPFPDAAVCRINDRPAANETVPLTEDPTYTEDCSKFPPANGYWSYWSSDDQGATWEFSQNGIAGNDPEPGVWEGWSFSLNATASTNPQPRTNLALAPFENAASAAAAADWIADNWDPEATQFASGLADNIIALAAAGSRPEVVSAMVNAMVSAAPSYVTKPDTLAKVLIALDAAGQDTRHFLGCERDLVSELDAFIAEDGQNLDSWWGPHLITIALNRLGEPIPDNVFNLLMDRQKDDGRFGYPDDTGLALTALTGITDNADNTQDMRDSAATAIAEVIAWTKDPVNQKIQDGDYYWTSFSPANSTSMLAGPLAQAGEDITSPQAFMRAQQRLTATGAWSNTLNGTNSNGMATTQGVLAVTGESYETASLAVEQATPECNVKPAFTTQPDSITVAAGDKASFTVAATGVPTPGITWEQEVDGIWTSVKDVTGATLMLESVGAELDGLRVRAVAANAEGHAVSEIAILTVNTVATTPPTTTPPATTPPAPAYPGAIYTTPGYHSYNDRNWFTSCEPYSATQRCRTLIQAKTVSESGGAFTTSEKWVFNNLTYLPSKKSTWAGNPLASTGQWTAADGRQWRTECNTAVTGGNGCRSYVRAQIIANVAKMGEPVRYQWVTKEIFNNIVQFS